MIPAFLRRLERGGGWYLEGATWVRGPFWNLTSLGLFAAEQDIDVQKFNEPEGEQ